MKFLDICAGIGGFRSGLEQAGHECVGYVEIDKYARLSYEAMYDTKGEWNREDITKVRADDIPQSDCWCFGFPCQDISVAGNRKGLSGKRSRIFYDIIKLLKSQSTENKPEWLLIENVKNLLSIDQGEGFTEVLNQISEAGYDCEWTLLNSKDFGVPQNRERVFIVGYLRERGRRKVLSQTRPDRQIDTEVKQIIPGNQAHRVYDSNGLSVTVKAEGGGVGAKTGLYTVPTINTIQQGKYSQDIILKEDSLSRSLMSRDYKGAQNVAVPVTNLYGKKFSDTRGNCIHSWDIELRGSCSDSEKELLQLILENRRHKEFGKKDGNPLSVEQIQTFTDFDNLEEMLERLTKIGYLKKIDNKYDMKFGQLSYEISDILDPNEPVKTLTSTDCHKHGVMVHNGKEYNIRRLTPKECFRLQGFTDDQFEKAQTVNSDTQLYKQAGNAVTVNVARYLGELIKEA